MINQALSFVIGTALAVSCFAQVAESARERGIPTRREAGGSRMELAGKKPVPAPTPEPKPKRGDGRRN